MIRRGLNTQGIDKQILGSLLKQYNTYAFQNQLKMGKSPIAQDLRKTLILMASIKAQNGSNSSPASVCKKKYVQKLTNKLKQMNPRKQKSIISQQVIKQAKYFSDLCQFIQNFPPVDSGSEGQKLKDIIQKKHNQAININQIDSFIKILLTKEDFFGKIKSQIESDNTSTKLVSEQKHQNPIDQEERMIQKFQQEMIQLQQPEQKQMNLVLEMEQEDYQQQNLVQINQLMVGNNEQVQVQSDFSQYGNNYNNQSIAESENSQGHRQMSMLGSQSQSQSDSSDQQSIYQQPDTNYTIQSNATDSDSDIPDRYNQDAMVEQHRNVFDSSDDSNATDSDYDIPDRQNQDAMVEQHRGVFDSSDDSN